MLTRSGLGALIVAVMALGLGWWWKYEELIVVGIAIGVVVGASIWLAQRPFRAEIIRRIGAIRVPRGDPINVAYRVRNTSRSRTGRATIVDYCAAATCRIKLEPVAPSYAVDFFGSMPTHRRGVFDIGPFEVERIDPFWLAIGTRPDRSTDSVTVHPKVYQLLGPQGAVRVIDSESVLRRASADPISGLMSMREYVAGDDPRLIHWPTTARTGVLMVRQPVEIRRPEFTVVLDASDEAGTADDFEEAVDVAATLAAHAVRSGFGVVLRTTSRSHPGLATPISDEGFMLDLLTPVQQVNAGNLLSVATLFSHGFDHTSVVVVTGPNGPSSRLMNLDQVVVVRIGEGAIAATGVAIAAAGAAEFALRWETWKQ
jgi:uncharacterized protein (DUF58 family)